MDSTKLILMTDSGSNYCSTKSQFCDILRSLTCFGHQPHLAIVNSIKQFSDMAEMLRKGRAIVSFINRSPKAYSNFFTNQVRFGINCRLRLIQSVDTRWVSEMQKQIRLQILSRSLAISLNESNFTVTRAPNNWKLSEVFTPVLSTGLMLPPLKQV